ncbi:sugar phosphate isomerase/epimerase [Oscillospiraceae bacterium CM]|nr:sugar phosphate isomerase/epimerase [Oscillospiraceae bacterium CM]
MALHTGDLQGRLYLSTLADDAPITARENGFGLEIAEFCTASNMDADFALWDGVVREKISGVDRRVLHAPFNELCPSAIDPLVLDVAKRRYEQAVKLARCYGINRIVVHSGYIPLVYFKEYFVERSVTFWRDFLKDKPSDLCLVLENVLEDSPQQLMDIVRSVDDKRLRLCIDVGHANIMRRDMTLEAWTRAVLPYLGHAHLHNNAGTWDDHAGLDDGVIDMETIIRIIAEGQKDATLTLETREAASSVAWLREKGFLQ